MSFKGIWIGNLISVKCCDLPLYFCTYRLCLLLRNRCWQGTHRHSTVDTVTAGSRNRGLVFGWSERHSSSPNVHTDSGYHSTSYRMGTFGFFPLGYSCRSVKLNTHLQLMMRRRISGVINQLSNAPSWRVQRELTFFFLICGKTVMHNDWRENLN